MTEQWQELKETIIKSTLKYLVKMQIEEGSVGFAVDNDPDHDCCWDDVLAWLEAQPCEDDFVKHKKEVLERIAKRESEIDKYIKELEALEQQPCEDCISRQAVLDVINFEDEWLFDAKSHNADTKIAFSSLESRVKALPSVTPQYTDEEIDKAQAVEQAYVDKMVELAVEESKQKWLESFDTSSATKCFEAVNILKERLEHEEI